MDDPGREELARRLALVEERIDRVTLRMTAGYGSESDREGWLSWLRQLRAQRDHLQRALDGATEPSVADDGGGRAG